MARFTSAGGGSGSGAPGPQGPQGPQGEPGIDATGGVVYLGNYILGNGYIEDIAVVRGSDNNLYIAKSSGGLHDPVNNTAEWDIFSDNTAGSADIADFVFTAEEGQSTISLPGDKQMRIQAGEDSDLYLTAGDDLYIQTLGFGDDIFVQAADDIRFTAGRENIEEGGRSYGWIMNSEGEFHLPENGYISNPYATVVTPGNRTVTYTDSYLNDQSGIIDQNGVALPVDIDSTWFVNNVYSGIFTSPAVISFADGDSTTAVAIYDATSQGTPAVIFQWNDANRTKTFEQIYPLSVSVNYTTTTYDGNPTIVLDPADNLNDQILVIEATQPNHIHLRAGGAIDQSTAELIIGGEDTHVSVSDSGNSVNILADTININSNASPSSLNINTYSGAVINSARTSTYADADKFVATLGDLIPGIQGETGPEGPAGRGFRFMGEWNDIATYVIDDVVTFNGESYIAILGSTVEYPPNTMYWTKIAAKGADNIAPTSGSWDAQFTDATGTLAGHTYTGNYNRVGNMIFYCVNVNFAGYTNLGTGQYQFTLPYAARQTFTSRAGTLHNHATDSIYHIAAIVDINEGNSNIAKLYYSGSTTDLTWKYNTPVSWASTQTHFDISGFYEIQP